MRSLSKTCLNFFFLNFALYYIPDKSVVQDLVQEAFIKLWEQRGGFTSFITAKTFLFKVVRNSCLNHIKHNKIKTKHAEEIKTNEIDDDSFYLRIIEEETYRIIHHTIESLSDKGKSIIKLNLQGYNNKEIAEITGVSVNTIKTHKKEAYKILKNKLKYLRIILFFSPTFLIELF